MSLIKNIKSYPSRTPSDKYCLLLCGFGGSIWQTAFLRKMLAGAGYNITAMDFPERIFSEGDPELLPQLMDEMLAVAEGEARKVGKSILLVGISLGSLISLNLMRRSQHFSRAVMIVGGDIVEVAQNIYGHEVWPQKYDELAKTWKDVNIYSDASQLEGKQLLFVLPAHDKLIDPQCVRDEVKKQTAAGNSLILIERRPFGHVGTIIEETILFPRRVLKYIKTLETAHSPHPRQATAESRHHHI